MITSKLIEQCVWTRPEVGWHKLNFDGASRGNLGKIGIGYIIYHWDGSIKAKMAKPIGETTNNMAELEAVVEGLFLCMEIDVKKVVVEGESHIVTNSLRVRQTQNWRLHSKLGRALDLFYLFEEVIINHIYRESNGEPDKLANLGKNRHSLKTIEA